MIFSQKKSSAPPPQTEQTLSPEQFQQIQSIHFYAKRLVSDAMSGEYKSAFKGHGMEFEEAREYLPGDDIRSIDWNVTARQGKPFVKIHREERELTVYLLVDASASLRFGSQSHTKHTLAATTAALLAAAAIHSKDRVGLMLFTDRIEHFVPPKRGRGHVWKVIRDVLTHTPEHSGTRIDKALEHLGRVVKRPSVVFLISDFMTDHYQQQLAITAQRHDVTTICVTDPREHELPNIGLMAVQDLETGQQTMLDTSDPKVRSHYQRQAHGQRQQFTQAMQRAGIGVLQITTDQSPIKPLLQYFRRKEHA